MNCSNLNAHLHSLHVVDSPACVCSHSIEDTAHSPLLSTLLHPNVSPSEYCLKTYRILTKLETLLFGDKNIDWDNITIVLAAHDYINDSERF